MKKCAHWYSLAAPLILTLALSILGTPGAAWSSLRDEMRQFHDFLLDHPKVSTELRANPNLVNSKKYLDKHDDLEKFLKRHPAVKREVLDHPRRAFGRYYQDDVPAGHADSFEHAALIKTAGRSLPSFFVQ